MSHDLFSFPQIPSVQRVGVLRPRRLDATFLGSATKLAERFGVRGKVTDTGARLIAQDDHSALEIFVATGSVRWSVRSDQRGEAESQPKLLDERHAVDRALTRLRELDLTHSAAALHSVTALELSFRRAGEKKETTWAIARQVNFRFKVGDLPFFGPGAKIQVSLGDGGKPVETLRFWREVDLTGEMATISPDHLVDILRRDETFSQLRVGESSVRFHECRLGYYALPPREAQTVLVPVFALSGTASTPALPRYDFMRYVPAITLPAKQGAAPARLRAVASF
jgi:hypothetical protein